MCESQADSTKTNSSLDLSVVVPVYNEVDNVAPLAAFVTKALSSKGLRYEIIFVDDGSTDGTGDVLRQLHATIPEVVVIRFRGNFGQSAALAAGFERANGNVIVTMDGDLQNDPADIPKLLTKLEEGYDVVSGWRKKRHDTFLMRRIPSIIANRIVCTVTRTKLHDTGCALKAYRRGIIERIHLYGEMHRFVPALSKMEGARIAEIVVNHRPRRFGRSKYNITRTFRVLLDLLTLNLLMKNLRSPIRFFGSLGVALTIGGLLSVVGAVMHFLTVAPSFHEINVIVTLAFLLWASGFQFIFLGLLAKLIVETGKQRHDYFFDRGITGAVTGEML